MILVRFVVSDTMETMLVEQQHSQYSRPPGFRSFEFELAASNLTPEEKAILQARAQLLRAGASPMGGPGMPFGCPPGGGGLPFPSQLYAMAAAAAAAENNKHQSQLPLPIQLWSQWASLHGLAVAPGKFGFSFGS